MTWTKKPKPEEEDFDQKDIEEFLEKDNPEANKSKIVSDSKEIHPAWDILFFFSSLRSAVMIMMIVTSLFQYGFSSISTLNFKPLIWEMLLLLSHVPGLIGMIGFFLRKSWSWWLVNMGLIQNIILYVFTIFASLYLSKTNGPEIELDQISIVLTMFFMILILFKFNSPVLQQKLKVKFTTQKMILISLLALLYGVLFTVYSIVFNS